MSDCVNIYLSSDDSPLHFPSNTAWDFTTQLPERMHLEGEWQCGLLEVHLPEVDSDQALYLCSDMCSDSIVGEKKLPVLGRVTGGLTQPSHVTYAKTRTRLLSSIRLYIVDGRGAPVSFGAGTSYCSLQLCKDESTRDRT